MSRPRLILVGNAKIANRGPLQPGLPTPVLSEFIDESDIVIRMNQVKNIGCPGIGSRTDILAIQNRGRQGQLYASWPKLSHPIFAGLREIVGSRPPDETPRPDLEVPEKLRDQDQMPEILRAHGWTDKVVSFIPWEIRSGLLEKLIVIAGERVRPSLGILAIEWVVHSPRFADYDKYIAGFGFKGTDAHQWPAELEVARQYHRQGLLKSIKPPPGISGWLARSSFGKARDWVVYAMDRPRRRRRVKAALSHVGRR